MTDKKRKQKNHRTRSTKTFEQSCEFCLCELRSESFINVFYNNEQKITNQPVRKDEIKDFKKRQRMTKAHL